MQNDEVFDDSPTPKKHRTKRSSTFSVSGSSFRRGRYSYQPSWDCVVATNIITGFSLTDRRVQREKTRLAISSYFT